MAASVAEIWASDEPPAKRVRYVLVGAAAACALVGIGISAALAIGDQARGKTDPRVLVPAAIGEALALAFWLGYVGYLLVQRSRRRRATNSP